MKLSILRRGGLLNFLPLTEVLDMEQYVFDEADALVHLVDG